MDSSPPRLLGQEERAQLKDSLRRAALNLETEDFEKFVGRIQASMTAFLSAQPEQTEGEARERACASYISWQTVRILQSAKSVRL